MNISEIFFSVQGEGINLGKPSVFVRTQGCNLRCDFCDTKYTWNEKEGKSMTENEVANEIDKYGCKHVVFTGGEPALQIDEIVQVIDMIDTLGLFYTFEIETNGTIDFSEKCDYFNLVTISPKQQSINKDVLKKFLEQSYTHVVFKFVVSSREDLSFWLNLIKELDISNDQVILMPEGVEDERLKKISLWLVDICKKYGFRFSPRLQIYLWGQQRGV